MTVSATTADGRARILADGNQMPMLGLGIWQVPNGQASVNAVRWALDLGYRHIDTAQAYGNEESVGNALRDSGLARDEVFITTKFYPGRDDPVAEARQSLRRLGVDQVDLYLVHWPQGDPVWAWPGMEQARELGYARSVGVSNFSAGELSTRWTRPTAPTGPWNVSGGEELSQLSSTLVISKRSTRGSAPWPKRFGPPASVACTGR